MLPVGVVVAEPTGATAPSDAFSVAGACEPSTKERIRSKREGTQAPRATRACCRALFVESNGCQRQPKPLTQR